MLSDAFSKAERIYRHVFPMKSGSPMLITETMDSMVGALCADLLATNVILRQRAAIAVFLSKWEKACAKEAAKK